MAMLHSDANVRTRTSFQSYIIFTTYPFLQLHAMASSVVSTRRVMSTVRRLLASANRVSLLIQATSAPDALVSEFEEFKKTHVES